jgi:hypothetical protein
MDCSLTLEQKFQLRKLALSLEGMDVRELRGMILETTEELLMQQAYFLGLMSDYGMDVETAEPFCLSLPETEEEMIDLFGRVPTDDELSDYINERIMEHMEAARIDVDIEAIALGLEE